ncbi:hypothetical protein MOV76_35715 [Rhizobium sp. PRIMUS64]|uniref:hypothetical protein n=1 Tax=Rhizobium sp. PRIMUS64 TaxID=2908925 RepID=UPI001FF2024E|nr:hypothetical protein [Rhizobium sp. PRIMUS64]MCJ9696913.1 hypothetical protein [Rhizobium sp. PRIMUS64]
MKPEEMLSEAMIDVVLERARQVSGEGFSLAKDDAYRDDELVRAGVSYAMQAMAPLMHGSVPPEPLWPWNRGWWKPKGRRRDLVRAAALLIAEIERIDRQVVKQ